MMHRGVARLRIKAVVGRRQEGRGLLEAAKAKQDLVEVRVQT